MSIRSSSVLSGYNPLTDPHLASHYSNRRRRKQLKSAGLIRKNGEIISDRDWLMKNQNKEARTHMKDLLAQAVVHKALEIERGRQVDIRNQLEMMAKKERVRRIRAERSKTDLAMKPIKVVSGAPRGRSASLQRGSGESVTSGRSTNEQTHVQKKREQKVHQLDYQTLKMIKKEVDRNRAFQPSSSPFQNGADLKPKKLARAQVSNGAAASVTMMGQTKSSGVRLHRPEPGMIVKVRQQSLCDMKYKYIGRPGLGESAFLEPEDVVIEQQHCGGETIKVYHGLLQPGQRIEFTSRRHRGYPYSIVMYVNNIRIERISSCCEYKHTKGAKLGTGTLQFLSVEGAAPCFKCNVRRGYLKEKPDPAPRPVSRASSKKSHFSAPRSHAEQEQVNQQQPGDDTEDESEKADTEDTELKTVSPPASKEAEETEVEEAKVMVVESTDDDASSSSDEETEPETEPEEEQEKAAPKGQANAPEEEDNHDEKSLTGSSVSDSDDDETSAPALTAVTETAKDDLSSSYSSDNSSSESTEGATTTGRTGQEAGS